MYTYLKKNNENDHILEYNLLFVEISMLCYWILK
jgi:hypothetical protein